MRNTLTQQVTYPKTAWLIPLVPVALTMAAAIIAMVVLRAPILLALASVAARRAARQRATLPETLSPDPALIFVPPAMPSQRALIASALVVTGIVLLLSFVAPMILTLVLLGPITALVVWGLLRWYESRYVATLDGELTAAVGRLSALLRSGNSFRQSVSKLLADMDDGPIKAEWSFLLDRVGTPLVGRDGIATPTQVVGALAVQTPSRRHATFLNHLAVAVSQPHDVLVTRVIAAYEALQASERRREEALTELAQMRYSGMAVGLAGVVMALYLVWTQWERVVVAYSSPVGVVVGAVVVCSLFLPIGGGMLLAQADDVDY
jgi:hypothetical protein